MIRLLLVLVVVLSSTACYTENRNGQLWACEETLNACVDTGLGAY